MNYGSFVSSNDYLNGVGGGNLANPGAVNELNKALATNSAIGSDGSALIPQSLETTLKVTTYRLKELKLWPRLFKKAAENTVEEYNVLNSYGAEENPFMPEGGLPNEDASEYLRETGLVKFMGTTRSITHPMTLVRTVGVNNSIVDQEDSNGTIHLLKLLEVALFYANDKLNPLAFKGFKQQIIERAPENVIDLRGEPLTAQVMEDIDLRAADNWGEIDTLYCTTRAKANLSKSMLGTDKMLRLIPQSATSTQLGMTVDKYDGNNSQFDITSHKMIRENTRPKSLIIDTLQGRVLVGPVIAATPVAAANLNVSSRLSAGTYTYMVSAVNDVGEGLPCLPTAPVAMAVNDGVQLQITNVPGARYYRIYRNRAGEQTLYLMDEVKSTGGQFTAYVDRGFWIPGCSLAFGLYVDGDQGMSFKQLAPLMKLPLAQINTSIRWSILLYGMLQIYQPRKQIMLINVGAKGMPDDATAEVDQELVTYLQGA